jgi:hypothetical protein
MQAFSFDAVESDDRLFFRKRGREPVASIGAELLVPLDERTGESWRERRRQEVELPERVTVLYMDREADHQPGSQQAKRAALPVPTMHSRHQASLELPIALDATTARRIADLGAPQATVHLRVVQLSAAVGRGLFSSASL